MLKKEIICLSGCIGASAVIAAAALTNPKVVFAQAATAVSLPVIVSTPSSLPSAPNSIPITLVDGTQAAQTLSAQAGTVADALRNDHLIISHQDRVAPALRTALTPGLNIVITRVHFADAIVHKEIPYKTVFKMSQNVSAGEVVHGHNGAPGILTLTYRTGYINGKKTKTWLYSRVVTRKPVDRVTLGGIRVASAEALPSRGGYNRLQCMNMIATGYTPYEGSGAGRCATGMRAGYGVVAVDPRVIPLGSRLYIQGYGYAVAGDTGGAILGNRIDLGSTTYGQAMAIGRRPVKVWILRPAR